MDYSLWDIMRWDLHRARESESGSLAWARLERARCNWKRGDGIGQGILKTPLTSCLTGISWQFLFLFAKQTNPNQSNRRPRVQWYFPLVFPALGTVTSEACLEIWGAGGEEAGGGRSGSLREGNCLDKEYAVAEIDCQVECHGREKKLLDFLMTHQKCD